MLPLPLGVNKPLEPVYTERQCQCRVNAAVTLAILVLLRTIKESRVAPERSCKPFWRESTDFNENCVTSIASLLTLTFSVNGPY